MLARQAVRMWRPAFQTSNVSTIAGEFAVLNVFPLKLEFWKLIVVIFLGPPQVHISFAVSIKG